MFLIYQTYLPSRLKFSALAALPNEPQTRMAEMGRKRTVCLKTMNAKSRPHIGVLAD
jgi:hypothetical protein